MSDENVTPISRATPSPDHPANRSKIIKSDADEFDWLTEADKLGKDFEKPAVLDQHYDAVADRMVRERAHMTGVTKELSGLQIQEEPIQIQEPIVGTNQFQGIDPLRIGVFITALVVAVGIFVTSALFGFAATGHAFTWTKPVWSWLPVVAPFFVEAFVVYFGLDTVVHARKGNAKLASSAVGWQLVAASVSAVANIASTVAGWGLPAFTTGWEPWVGILLAAAAPLSVVLITKRVSKLVFTSA